MVQNSKGLKEYTMKILFPLRYQLLNSLPENQCYWFHMYPSIHKQNNVISPILSHIVYTQSTILHLLLKPKNISSEWLHGISGYECTEFV